MRGLAVLFFFVILSIGFLSFSQEKGLIAYWSFDEGEGNIAYDYSGNENNAQIRGAKLVEGVSGNALYLDGRGAIVCGEGLELCFVFSGDYSIEAWVKHTSKNPQIYISKWTGAGSQSAWWLGYFESAVQFGDYYNGGQVRIKGPDVADGEWHHIVGVREGEKLFLYVDGGRVAEGQSLRKVAGDNSAPMIIGGFGRERTPQWSYEGVIDEVRVYSGAISEEEIRRRYELINSKQKPLTLSPISDGMPLDFYVGATTASIYLTKENINFSLLLVASKPIIRQRFTVLIRGQDGKIFTSLDELANFQKGQKARQISVNLPPLSEGNYKLQVYIRGEKKFEKTIVVRDIEPVKRNNMAMVRQKAKANPFYRGIVSAYAGMRYLQDGTPDIQATISLLKDLKVNCYTYLIAYRSDKELASLGDFCDKALKERMEVWVYLVPPSEAPQNGEKPISERKYPPFDMDYLKWAEAIAKISLEHPNLTLWMIDDFDSNLGFFTLDYTKQVYQTTKKINPKLLFGVCVYHENLENFIKAGYLNYVDSLLWGYQHNSSLYPDCGFSPNTLPLEINDYLKKGKIAIPCIYFTPHSSWPKGRPTKEYLEKAMDIAFEQAGIVWVYTTPTPGTFQYDVVKKFTDKHKLPFRKW